MVIIFQYVLEVSLKLGYVFHIFSVSPSLLLLFSLIILSSLCNLIIIPFIKRILYISCGSCADG